MRGGLSADNGGRPQKKTTKFFVGKKGTISRSVHQCNGRSPSGNGRQASAPFVQCLPEQCRRRRILGERIGAPILFPAGRRRPRPRKPPGLHLRFPPRPEGLPKAPSPVLGRTAPLIPEETSVSSGEGGTRGTPPKWGNVPLSGREPPKLEEFPRARRLTRGIGHRVNSTASEDNHAESMGGNRRIGEVTASKQKGHACPRKRRRGDRRVRTRRLSLKRNGQRFCKGTGKGETRKLCLTSAGEILC